MPRGFAPDGRYAACRWALNDTPTWVVDEANGLSELETRLNHLEGEGFAVYRVFLLHGLQPEFVILARRAEEGRPQETTLRGRYFQHALRLAKPPAGPAR